MKITDIEIKNFRSLKDVSMKGLGNLVIIIGRNSTGKSNFLEALNIFFSHFDPAPQRTLGGLSDYIWFDRKDSNPIEFSVSFELSKEETEKILPSFFKDWVGVNDTNSLEVVRRISNPAQSATISTTSVKMNNILLISEGQLIIPSDPLEIQRRRDPSTPVKQAIQPAVQSNEVLSNLLQNLYQLFQKAFQYIYATRDVPRNHNSTPSLAQRNSIIQSNISQELIQTGGSLDLPQEERWRNIEDIVKSSNEIEDVRVISNQVMVTERGNERRFPISLIGEGNQELFTLAHQLSMDYKIFGIEEPEIHLHPELARNLFNKLKQISESKQLIITTHSTIFVDQAEPANTWIATKDNGETKIRPVGKRDDLHRILLEVGARPSDIFYSNSILFVEGHTEKVVIPLLAKKLGVDFAKHGLNVIPIRGKDSGNYHLKIWAEATKNVGIPFFMILDKDAEEVANKLSELKNGENLFLLKKGTIESYYPIDVVLQALKEEYNIEPTDEDKEQLKEELRKVNGNVPEILEEILKKHYKKQNGWKVRIGERVASMIELKAIDDELKSIIERIRTNLDRSHPAT